MIAYSIPEAALKGFHIYFGLSKENLGVLKSIFSEIEFGDRISHIVERGEGRMTIDSKEYESMMKSLLSIINSYIDSKDSKEKFVKEFSESIVSSGEEYQLSEVISKIDHVLSGLSNLIMTRRAKEVQLSNSINFSSSRIITDIRIVYESDLSASQQYAVVVHKLKIDTFEGENQKSIYISLDNHDLHNLKEAVDRAIQKDANIKNLYSTFDFIEFKNPS